VELCICKPRRFVLSAVLSLLGAAFAWGQQSSSGPEIPSNFKLDMETAARLRPQLRLHSEAAAGRNATAALVFDRLVQQTAPKSRAFEWQLRIVDDDQLNAYASPDGTVYVESGLAKLAGPSSGLWAAILSHEIAHILGRDWARRYLYQQALERNSNATIALGDPGMPSSSWSDSEKASGDLAHFCRQMEIDADREGLILMAEAGYHPDFVPALHHLLHARGSDGAAASLYAMHPCWEERDRELSQAYVAASIEFERRWPEWFASPGGNPPVVVFAEEPTVRRAGSHEWEVRVPLRCQNLAGAVEVVLRAGSAQAIEQARSRPEPDASSHGELKDERDGELHQLTGCTSPRTTVTFKLPETSTRRNSATRADVYVLDAWGAVLARTDLPKLPR
jgi:Peptidase family M48